jgi:hypothetical protein
MALPSVIAYSQRERERERRGGGISKEEEEDGKWDLSKLHFECSHYSEETALQTRDGSSESVRIDRLTNRHRYFVRKEDMR